MKLIHLSDLHIGKRVNGFSMLPDQRWILDEILKIIDAEQPQVVLLAGDIYDKTVPSAEAVSLLDDFLVSLCQRVLDVFVISGNHDSPERIAFGGRLMQEKIHLSPVYNGIVAPITLTDAFGEVAFYLLPFLKPLYVRQVFPEENIESYTDALDCAIAHMEIDTNRRNVLVTHQFVTGAERSDSEELSVGGADNVSAEVFAPFDYTALGHIHTPQTVHPNIRYCGTPLKYSFSEAKHDKSVTIVELSEKGVVAVRTVPLHPLRDMREIKGSYQEVSGKEFYESFDRESYLHVTLTDEEDVPDAVGKLRRCYPNLMKLDYDNRRTQQTAEFTDLEDVEQRSELELFEELYQLQNNKPISQQQKDYLEKLMTELREEAQ